MTLFEHSTRTRVVDAVGAVDSLGSLARDLGARRVLLVTSPAVAEAGHAERGRRSLEVADLVTDVFADTAENPSSEDVERCAQRARAFEPDLWVGLGGGSAIDTAKGANFLVSCGGTMRDYAGRATAPRPLLPLIAVPTTAGTGTEVQSFALIGDPETKQKMACGDPSAAPRVAVLDASLTLTQPRFVAACTGLDAIGHAVETAVCNVKSEASLRFSLTAFELAAEAFPRVLDEPSDLGARARMLRAAALAGLAIENSMLGAAHSMANPLTARRGLPHGQAVGTALPHVVRFNCADDGARATYAELARAAGWADADTPEAEAAERLAAGLAELLRRAGMPAELGACGVRRDDCGALAAEAARQWTAQFNPRRVRAPELAELYAAAL